MDSEIVLVLLAACGVAGFLGVGLWLNRMNHALARALDRIRTLEYRGEIHWKLIHGRRLAEDQLEEQVRIEAEVADTDRREAAWAAGELTNQELGL